MSGVTSTGEWLAAGGLGAGTWLVLAVLIKAAADGTRPAPAPPAPPRPVLHRPGSVPPPPLYPPSTGRHAAGPPRPTPSPAARAHRRARHSKGPVT